MAMSRLCTMGAVLFAGASAGSYDWDKYMKQYAGNYSADADKYAGDYSQDWVARAQQYQRQYAGKYAGGYEAQHAGNATPAAAAMVLAEGMPAENGTSRSEELFASRNSSARQAQAAIQELEQWNAKLERDLKDQNFSRMVAEGIVTNVQSNFEEERERLQQDFNSSLRNMSKAGSVGTAEKAAKEAMHKLQHLDHKEAHAMRKTLSFILKAGKAKAKALWETARKAAHQVYKLGMTGARAQIHEGLREDVYERTMLDTEKLSEGLTAQAEEAAERSELLVEQQSDSVEARLEDLMHGLRQRAVAAQQLREERLHEAEAASEAAGQAGAAPQGGSSRQRPAAAPAQEAAEQRAPTAFLARGSSQDFSGTLIAPLACVAMLVGMTTLLAARFCRSSVTIEHPLLG